MFTNQPNFQPVFNSKGIHYFIIQAKDKAGNVSEPIYFGAYHYLMLDEDIKQEEAIRKEAAQSKIKNFYIYDYSNGNKGGLLKKIQINTSKNQKVEVPSNNLLIEWDGINKNDFNTMLKIRFDKGKVWDKCPSPKFLFSLS
ncbi:hypothetical protein COX58_01385 [archaeon CG_4_10_14_0_2_um_filter_Archaea_38_6]|nr:MAG: hypothetical protein COX58_01385 [archaeon CG_4_10_14_0_2_um_filter_Archaea_38_6]